jgi:phytoene dehydrogenase-like protein
MPINRKACVVGSGPNGLAAAIVLAQAGIQVNVFEAEGIPGGAARTMELTLPGFHHDFGSAVYPFGISSPFFSALPLAKYGLEWIHSPAPVAHPLADGSAVILQRDPAAAENSLAGDGHAWHNLVQPFVERWTEFVPEVVRPIWRIPKHPLLMARFAAKALRSARAMAAGFRNQRTRTLFAGLAGHSLLSFDEALSGTLGLLMAISAHAVGWPVPRGGAQSLTNSLCQHLSTLGGTVTTSARVNSLSDLSEYALILCDITPRQLLRIGGDRFSESYQRELARYRYGPGVFKVDYALREPIPWKARECSQAATVHLGGSFEEIAASEKSMSTGEHSKQPFVLLAQPTLFDASRTPAGKHTAWAYCHVPNGSRVNMLEPLENQIERFAPGFRETVLARRIFLPADLESMDANLVGGDITGGAMDIRQFLLRPTLRQYATSAKHIFLCSASTPPGGSVHGMCGYYAAKLALTRLPSQG